MKRFSIQVIIFITIGVALFLVHGIIRHQSLAGFPNSLFAAAIVLSLPAAAVSIVSAAWKRLQWSTISGAVTVPLTLDVVLMPVASPDLWVTLAFIVIGAVSAAASYRLTEKC